MSPSDANDAAVHSLDSLRTYVEGYPQGGRIEPHVHDWDPLALISHSAAIIETDSVYLVHPLMKALWLPAGVEHSVYSPRPFYLHALYLKPRSIRRGTEPQILGLDNLARELVLFLCAAGRRGMRRQAPDPCRHPRARNHAQDPRPTGADGLYFLRPPENSG